MNQKTIGGVVRHPSLPVGLNNEQLANWLELNSVETFTDTLQTVLTPEDISGHEKESVTAGREINKLEDILSLVRDHVKKGSEDKLSIKIPATLGVKELTAVRRQNDDLVESGAISETRTLYGIPNTTSEQMEYFDIEGNIIDNRTRSLSAKEKHEHLGMFQGIRDKNAASQNVDPKTGEMKDGTND